MKKWAVVIFKADNSLDWFSVYAENREEAEKMRMQLLQTIFRGQKFLILYLIKKN